MVRDHDAVAGHRRERLRRVMDHTIIGDVGRPTTARPAVGCAQARGRQFGVGDRAVRGAAVPSGRGSTRGDQDIWLKPWRIDGEPWLKVTRAGESTARHLPSLACARRRHRLVRQAHRPRQPHDAERRRRGTTDARLAARREARRTPARTAAGRQPASRTDRPRPRHRRPIPKSSRLPSWRRCSQ